MCIVPITYRCTSTGHITLTEWEARAYPYPSGNACACPTILYDRSGQTSDYDCPTCEAVRQRWNNRNNVLSMVASGAMIGGVPGLRPVQRPQGINNGRNTAVQEHGAVGLGEAAKKKRMQGEKRKAEEEALRIYGTREGSCFQTNPAVSKRRRKPYPVPASMSGGGEQGSEKGTEERAGEAVGGESAVPVEVEGERAVTNGDRMKVSNEAGKGSGDAVVEDEDDQSMFVPE